jgi:hypothetical protein
MLDSMPLSPAESSADAGTATAESTHAPEPSRQHRGGLRAWIGDMLHFIVWQRDIPRATAEFEALDARMLRDIGLY